MTYVKSSASDNWYTPEALFLTLADKYGPFDLDVAASNENAKCVRFYTKEQDGRKMPWDGHVWCNPPYRDLLSWAKIARQETLSGICPLACCLFPAQTSTEWFHDYALPFAELHWIRGKQKFGGCKDRAFMPSVAVIFRA